MLDKATVLTTLFTIVDDTMKGSAVIQQALKRPGPAPSLSDSELVTIALYSGTDRRTARGSLLATASSQFATVLSRTQWT